MEWGGESPWDQVCVGRATSARPAESPAAPSTVGCRHAGTLAAPPAEHPDHRSARRARGGRRRARHAGAGPSRRRPHRPAGHRRRCANDRGTRRCAATGRTAAGCGDRTRVRRLCPADAPDRRHRGPSRGRRAAVRLRRSRCQPGSTRCRHVFREAGGRRGRRRHPRAFTVRRGPEPDHAGGALDGRRCRHPVRRRPSGDRPYRGDLAAQRWRAATRPAGGAAAHRGRRGVPSVPARGRRRRRAGRGGEPTASGGGARCRAHLGALRPAYPSGDRRLAAQHRRDGRATASCPARRGGAAGAGVRRRGGPARGATPAETGCRSGAARAEGSARWPDPVRADDVSRRGRCGRRGGVADQPPATRRRWLRRRLPACRRPPGGRRASLAAATALPGRSGAGTDRRRGRSQGSGPGRRRGWSFGAGPGRRRGVGPDRVRGSRRRAADPPGPDVGAAGGRPLVVAPAGAGRVSVVPAGRRAGRRRPDLATPACRPPSPCRC